MGPKSKVPKRSEDEQKDPQVAPTEYVTEVEEPMAFEEVGAEATPEAPLEEHPVAEVVGALTPKAKPYNREGRTTEKCDQCKKHLRPNMGRANDPRTPMEIHKSRCYLCKYCHTYRTRFSKHEENCNVKTYREKLEKAQDNDGNLTKRRCPICGVPQANCITHMHQGHHLSYDELARYRLIAPKSTSKLTKEAARALHDQAQLQVEILVLSTCVII